MMSRRTEQSSIKRCARCLYPVEQVGWFGHCPECGTEFNLNDADTFRDLPEFERWRFWLPGAIAAIVFGGFFTAMGVAGGKMGAGEATAIFSLIAVCVLLGYRWRVGRRFFGVYIAIALGFGISHGWGEDDRLQSVLLATAFYGMIGSPWIGCSAFGAFVRHLMKSNGFSQGGYLP